MPYYCIIYCFTVYINKARNYVIKGAVFFVEVQQSPNASPLRHSSPQLCAQPPHNADCRASLLVTSRCLSHLPGRRAASSSAQGLDGRGKAGLPGLGFSLPSKLSASHFYALRAFGSLPAPCFLPCHRREPQIRLIWSDWSDWGWSIQPRGVTLANLCSLGLREADPTVPSLYQRNARRFWYSASTQLCHDAVFELPCGGSNNMMKNNKIRKQTQHMFVCDFDNTAREEVGIPSVHLLE